MDWMNQFALRRLRGQTAAPSNNSWAGRGEGGGEGEGEGGDGGEVRRGEIAPRLAAPGASSPPDTGISRDVTSHHNPQSHTHLKYYVSLVVIVCDDVCVGDCIRLCEVSPHLTHHIQ